MRRRSFLLTDQLNYYDPILGIAENLRTETGLTSCGPTVAHDFSQIPSEYRPVPSPKSTSCEFSVTSQGFLRGMWNPRARPGKTGLYLGNPDVMADETLYGTTSSMRPSAPRWILSQLRPGFSVAGIAFSVERRGYKACRAQRSSWPSGASCPRFAFVGGRPAHAVPAGG